MRNSGMKHAKHASHKPGERLIGLSCLVVEMADQTLASHDAESAQALVELAMATLHTACLLQPSLQAELDQARHRLDQVTASILAGLGPQDDDPDDRWPYRVA